MPPLARTVASLLALAVLAGCVSSPAGTLDVGALDGAGVAEDPPIEGKSVRSGYLQTRDGTLLAYNLVLPGEGSGTYPTLMDYSGYAPGSAVDAGYVARYVPKGYAVLGVNVRGTGCSGGAFDFFEPRQAEDGYDAVEWAAAQPWSDGKVAMIGKSFPGITQLFVAAERPPHLVAAAPGHVYGDVYRDVAYPGGIFNYAFAGLWSFVAQPVPGVQAGGAAIASGDETCARHNAARQAENARKNAFLQAQEHRFDDALMRERSPAYLAERIEVPLFLVQSWQDEQVGVRGVGVVEGLAAPWYLTLTNGDHGMYRTETSMKRLDAFLERYVKGVPNGFEAEPRVLVWWEAPAATRAPAWTTNHTAWPVPEVRPLELRLVQGGRLAEADAPAGPQTYAYPAGSSSNGAGHGFGWPASQTTDRLAAPGPTRATWQTDPLPEDVLVLGPANLTLRFSSTAPDTDLQVTVSEVRPDGKVVTVQRGWLRASHRALDGERSDAYRPVHPHDQEVPLAPGEPVTLSVEVHPFGHAFRAGSRLRMDVEAPTALPELWGFAALPTPALNTVHEGTLRLPVLPGAAGAPLPPCGSLIRQACR